MFPSLMAFWRRAFVDLWFALLVVDDEHETYADVDFVSVHVHVPVPVNLYIHIHVDVDVDDDDDDEDDDDDDDDEVKSSYRPPSTCKWT